MLELKKPSLTDVAPKVIRGLGWTGNLWAGYAWSTFTKGPSVLIIKEKIINREGRWFATLYTCNYGPGGNYIRGQMYRRGKQHHQHHPRKLKVIKLKSFRFSLLSLSKGFLMLPTIPGPLHLTKTKYTSLLLELDLAFISDPKLGLF